MSAAARTTHVLAVNLNHPGHYLHWGVIQISVANVIVILVMMALFVAALLVPFPKGGGRHEAIDPPDAAPPTPEQDPAPQAATGGWTGALRRRSVAALPPDKLLPDTQPAYVSSWIYVFGVLTLSALLVVLISGGLLAVEGPSWWHGSSVGHYVNSVHLWSVQLFMGFMVIHLWGKFWMAAWRGRRTMTWITGVVAFMASIGTAFTGYATQQNFDSQWLTTQAKDGLNSVGVGAYFNVLDFGQMLMWHIVLLPLALGAIVVIHVLMVRKRGVVPPLPEHEPPPAERELPERGGSATVQSPGVPPVKEPEAVPVTGVSS